jgi:hypothetical protein
VREGIGAVEGSDPTPVGHDRPRAMIRISIATPSGPVDAILTVYCLISADGQRPTNVEEGIRLLIPGVINSTSPRVASTATRSSLRARF